MQNLRRRSAAPLSIRISTW